MKKLFILISLAVMMAACSQEGDSPVIPQQEASGAKTAIRSVDDAMAVAAQVADLGTQGRGARQLVDKSKVAIVTSRSSRSGAGDTLMYAIDFEDEQGFVIVSAPKCVEPILAVTEKGSYTSYETMQNQGLQFALEAAENYVANKSYEVVIRPPLTPICYYDTVTNINNKIAPRIKVTWNQAWPENLFCPNQIAGCVPVAIGQILTYFKTPASLTYTYPDHDIDSETINWYNIEKHKKSLTEKDPTWVVRNEHNDNCPLNMAGHVTIGRIVRQIGHLVNAHYYTDGRGTGVYTQDAFKGLRSLLTGKTFKEGSNTDNLLEYIKNYGVAFVRGSRLKEDGNYVGHAWVADAYWHYKLTVKYYEMSENYGEGYILKDTKTEEKQCLHYNWGWNGNGNGYFLTSIFCPAKAEEYDDQKINTTSDYKYGVGFLHIK